MTNGAVSLDDRGPVYGLSPITAQPCATAGFGVSVFVGVATLPVPRPRPVVFGIRPVAPLIVGALPFGMTLPRAAHRGFVSGGVGCVSLAGRSGDARPTPRMETVAIARLTSEVIAWLVYVATPASLHDVHISGGV